jgi:LuxR family maltose regulon positive regulatory protein
VFAIRLDDIREWYRYHDLFADVLRAQLHDSQTRRYHCSARARERLTGTRNGEPAGAIRHAMAAEDFAHAEDLVELAIRPCAGTGKEGTVHGC